MGHQQVELEVGVEQPDLEWNYQCRVPTMRHEILDVDASVEVDLDRMQLHNLIGDNKWTKSLIIQLIRHDCPYITS